MSANSTFNSSSNLGDGNDANSLHRRILSSEDLSAFLASESFARIESFLLQLNESVRGRPRPGPNACNESSFPQIAWALELLTEAYNSIDQHPPTEASGRFGNSAFRDWIFDLQERLLPIRLAALKEINSSLNRKRNEAFYKELGGYFVNSLGSSTRIDYGTGHELHFLIFLMGLNDLIDDAQAELVLSVFSEYLRLMRRLQSTYWLEPAGSHGVWGLDDYHFLPFLFGAAQLSGHPHLRPRAINDPEIVQYLAPQYLYFEAIENILAIKQRVEASTVDLRAPEIPSAASRGSSLRWLSPVLDDISAVKTWEKVNSGLIKMWRVEVMSKLPIMQHLLFGNEILSWQERRGQDSVVSNHSALDDGVIQQHYTHSAQGDCCGNPLPSIYSALKGKLSQQPKQPGLPFD